MDKHYTEIDALEQSFSEASLSVNGLKSEKTENEDVTVRYALLLDSKTSIHVYFIPNEGYTGTVTAKIDGVDAEVTQLTSAGYEGWYEVRIDGIGPSDLGNKFTVMAYTDHGCAQIKVSVMSYVNAVLEDNLFFKNYGPHAMAALYRYWLAAIPFSN